MPTTTMALVERPPQSSVRAEGGERRQGVRVLWWPAQEEAHRRRRRGPPVSLQLTSGVDTQLPSWFRGLNLLSVEAVNGAVFLWI